jgi:hypothetical protein
MSALSRRRVLVMMATAPVAIVLPIPASTAGASLSVGEAMRYLCRQVFPSPHQKRGDLDLFETSHTQKDWDRKGLRA